MREVDVRAIRSQFVRETGEPFSQQDFSNMIGTTWGSVSRWENDRNVRGLKPATRRMLSGMQTILEAIGDDIPPEERAGFFTRNHPDLLGMRPIELCSIPNGTEAILARLQPKIT